MTGLAIRLEGYLVVAGAVVAMCAAAYLCALVEARLEAWRQWRRFRRQLRAAEGRLEAPQPRGSGREPPPR